MTIEENLKKDLIDLPLNQVVVKFLEQMIVSIQEVSNQVHNIETINQALQRDVTEIVEEIEHYSLSDMESNINDIERKNEELEDRINELNENSELDSKVDDLEKDIRDATNSIEDLESRIEDQQGMIEDVESKVSDMESNVEKSNDIEDTVEGLKHIVEQELKKEMDEFKMNMVSFTEIQGTILDLTSRVDDLNALIFPKPKEEIIDAIIEEEIKL